MAQPTKEQFEALKAKHPSATILACMGQTVIARKPNRVEYKRYRSLLLREETRANAHESLLPCILWPEPSAVDAMLEEYPVLEISFGNELLKLAGNEAPVEKKEL